MVVRILLEEEDKVGRGRVSKWQSVITWVSHGHHMQENKVHRKGGTKGGICFGFRWLEQAKRKRTCLFWAQIHMYESYLNQKLRWSCLLSLSMVTAI